MNINLKIRKSSNVVFLFFLTFCVLFLYTFPAASQDRNKVCQLNSFKEKFELSNGYDVVTDGSSIVFDGKARCAVRISSIPCIKQFIGRISGLPGLVHHLKSLGEDCSIPQEFVDIQSSGGVLVFEYVIDMTTGDITGLKFLEDFSSQKFHAKYESLGNNPLLLINNITQNKNLACGYLNLSDNEIRNKVCSSKSESTLQKNQDTIRYNENEKLLGEECKAGKCTKILLKNFKLDHEDLDKIYLATIISIITDSSNGKSERNVYQRDVQCTGRGNVGWRGPSVSIIDGDVDTDSLGMKNLLKIICK